MLPEGCSERSDHVDGLVRCHRSSWPAELPHPSVDPILVITIMKDKFVNWIMENE